MFCLLEGVELVRPLVEVGLEGNVWNYLSWGVLLISHVGFSSSRIGIGYSWFVGLGLRGQWG